MVAPALQREVVRFTIRGNNRLIFDARDPEILIEGMAGTGKTRTVLELFNALAHRFPGFRGLIVRKVAATLATSCLVTFEQKVLKPGDGVRFFGGSSHEAASYKYGNGSRIVVGGMDNPEKVLSSEYDAIYFNEVTDGGIEDWETLLGRLRGHVLPNPRIFGDCNPTYGTHWVNRRAEAGLMRRIVTRIEDNPEYFDEDGTPTEAGRRYLAMLDRMSGSRYKRYRLGEWAGVENAIYETFDRDQQVVDLEPGLIWRDSAFGADYGRVHKAAGVALGKDQYGRVWVREAWGKPDLEHGETTAGQIAGMVRRYGLKRGATDPTTDTFIGILKHHNVQRTKLAEGDRQHRIDLTSRYMRVFIGGAVPSLKDEMEMRWPVPEPARPDSYGLLFVRGAPGIEELCDEIAAYHYAHLETPTKDSMVVVRKDDDLVAALENGIWALDEYGIDVQPDYFGGLKSAPMQMTTRSVKAGV